MMGFRSFRGQTGVHVQSMGTKGKIAEKQLKLEFGKT